MTTNGENTSTANDQTFATLGELTAPNMHQVNNSAFTPNALAISWYPAQNEHANSYRILRSSSKNGSFELIGESVYASFTDTLVTDGETDCYKVQSYNGNLNVSDFSDVLCGLAGERSMIYLPFLVK